MNLVEVTVCLPDVDCNYDAYRILENTTLGMVGGFTAFPARGGWINPNNKKIIEEAIIRVEFTTTPDIAGLLKAVYIDVLKNKTEEQSLYWCVKHVIGDPIINLREKNG